MKEAVEERLRELRALPAVSAVLARPVIAALAGEVGLTTVTRAVRDVIESARAELVRSGSAAAVTDARIAARVEALRQGSLVRVLNATGVVVHTNLGRVPLAREAMEAAERAATDYVTLEYDLAEGRRGHRHVHVRDLLVGLTGAEDALVVNNNAAALLLALSAGASGREAIVSRGELVEIGGGFRIPDVVAQSGAVLREVGTTNRTHASDYEAAISAGTAVLLKVHQSNFEIRGFVAEVSLDALAALAHARGLPVIYDAGSGCMTPIAPIVREPSVREQLAAGADVVCFSGDKLLGGPQAGILVGKHALLEAMRRAPLYRALRPDKITLAALGATLELWRDRPEALPIVRMLRARPEELDARARAVMAEVDAHGATLGVCDAVGRIGGGAAPSVELASRALRISGTSAEALAMRLRHGAPKIVARIEDDAVWIDLRCVPAEDDDAIARALGAALAP